jgi:hypothetical protein
VNADQTLRTFLGWTVPDHVTFAFEVALVCRHTEHGDDYPAIWWSAPDRIGRFLQAHAHGFVAEYQPADPETASERPTQPGGTGRASDPRHDPIGTVRIGRDGRAVVKVSMGDETGKGQHVWVHVTQELEQRWFHHNEVAGLASERPDAGRERMPEGYAKELERVRDGRLKSLTGECDDANRRANVANQRASSWWEAAKHWYVCSRQHEAVAKGQTARADAAEAKLAEIERLRDLVGHFTGILAETARLVGATPDDDETVLPMVRRVAAERDEARAKLDEIRDRAVGFHAFLLGPGSRNPDQVRTRAVGALDGIRAVFEDATDREEPARAVDVRHIGRSWEDHPLEDDCPCPKAPCGLVSTDSVVPECQHHPGVRAKTIRQSHLATSCPARGEEPAGEVQR